ncbi:MAG: exodeoxyribonuclease V subunit gamma, partial [bacterium]
MQNVLQVFYSNRVERLYLTLKEQLFSSATSPFTKRFVIVPSPAMKAWLMTRLADDPEIGIAAGIAVSYLEPTVYEIIETMSAHPESFPKYHSNLELALCIEAEIRRVLAVFPSMAREEKDVWSPLFDYLQCATTSSRKSERRLIALSDKLAGLFQEYGKFGTKMLRHWKNSSEGGWQAALWRKLVGEIGPEHIEWQSSNAAVHLFSMSFLSRQQHQLLVGLSETIPVHYYLLSPCQVFWSDILSDREGRKLQENWEKQGISDSREFFLEEYLYDRNPLLANFGRLGREMTVQIEESGAITDEDYELPGNPSSILEAVQTDILLLRNPDPEKRIDLPNNGAIQVHVAGNRMREVQILYDTILGIIEKHAEEENPILPEDFIVMAPDIMDYDP